MNLRPIEWFHLYIGTGVAVVVLGRLVVKLFYKQRRSEFLTAIQLAFEAEKSPGQRLLDFVKQAGMAAFVVTVWPLAVLALLWEPRSKNRRLQLDEDDVHFTATKKDLVGIVKLQEVEAHASIDDPLSRAPTLPFGHLNPGWVRLRGQMQPGDVLWYFQTPGHPMPSGQCNEGPAYSGPTGVVRGYAVVRRGQIVAEFLSEWG